jgi:rhomboid family GlyGly-CTERM serine protease
MKLMRRLKLQWLEIVLVSLLLIFGAPFWRAEWAELQPQLSSIWWQPWRLLLSHWIHFSWPHLLLNAAALIGWHLLWPELPGERLLKLFWISLAAGLGIWWVSDATFVIGLSGLLHGLFVASATAALLAHRERAMSCTVLLIVALKLAVENGLGPSAATEELIGLPVAVEAHWVGAAAGAGYAGIRWCLDKCRPPRPSYS